MFTKSNHLTKLPHSTFQIFFYALRPGFIRTQTLTRWHLLNVVVQLIFDAVLVHFAGSKALIYLLMSSFLAGSLHPCAGHFIAEHYVWDGLQQETYSYYGWLNVLAYNVISPMFFARVSPMLSMFLFRLVTITNTTTSLPSHGRASPLSANSHQNSTTYSHHTHHGQW